MVPCVADHGRLNLLLWLGLQQELSIMGSEEAVLHHAALHC